MLGGASYPVLLLDVGLDYGIRGNDLAVSDTRSGTQDAIGPDAG